MRDWFKLAAPAPDPDGPSRYSRFEQEQYARWRKALDDFGYHHEIVRGPSADTALASAKLTGLQDKHTPVVVVPGYWNSEAAPPDQRSNRAREILKLPEFDAAFGKQYLADGLLAMYDDLELDPDCPNPEEFDRLESIEVSVGKSGLAIIEHYVAEEKATKVWDEVAVLHVPAAASEELPAFFDWGGWNAVPTTAEIVAVARYWREAYEAELVALGPDLVEFQVPRKPANHAAAVALLKEHYVFAPDSLEFDRQTLEEASARLRVSSSWLFWWD